MIKFRLRNDDVYIDYTANNGEVIAWWFVEPTTITPTRLEEQQILAYISEQLNLENTK